MNHLFVYGTLTQNSNHHMAEFLRENSIYMGKAYVFAKMYLVDDYPGITLSSKSSDKVFGHIHQILEKDKVLQVLDNYEEAGPNFPAPQEYRRELITVHSINSPLTRICWAYLYNRPTDHLLPILSGKFTEKQF